MPEEVVLLVENGISTLLDDSTAMHAASTEELVEWNKEQKRSLVGQTQLQLEREAVRSELETTKEMAGRKNDEEAIRKRKEREERRARNIELLSGGDAALSESPSGSKPQEQAADLELQPQVRYTIRIPPVSSPFPWYRPRSYDNMESAKRAGIWLYPQTLEEQSSCKVFRYLWEKGFYLGSGIKFGGDFLVYPGQNRHFLPDVHVAMPSVNADDPLRYHSHFVASVLPSLSTVLWPMEIVAHGRLGTATKKAHLLCGWDENKQEVSCYSVEWSSFG